MRHRRGWGLMLLVVAACAIAALVLVGMMTERASSAERLDSDRIIAAPLRPGEIDLLAKVVAAEARGESDAGMLAIAWVVLNRLDDPETFGRTLTRILLAPRQFAKPLPISDASPAYLKAMLATLRAVLGDGDDPSLGSTHFHVCGMRPIPGWARQMERRIVLGKHCFYRDRD